MGETPYRTDYIGQSGQRADMHASNLRTLDLSVCPRSAFSRLAIRVVIVLVTGPFAFLVVIFFGRVGLGRWSRGWGEEIDGRIHCEAEIRLGEVKRRLATGLHVARHVTAIAVDIVVQDRAPFRTKQCRGAAVAR